MTVARPQIRELAPYQYYDFLRDRGVEGNPDLKRTRIHNADLRWEWFFDEGQVVAASLFDKRFTNPIELTILDPDHRRLAVPQRHQRPEPGGRARAAAGPGPARLCPAALVQLRRQPGHRALAHRAAGRAGAGGAGQPAAGGAVALRRQPVTEVFRRAQRCHGGPRLQRGRSAHSRRGRAGRERHPARHRGAGVSLAGSGGQPRNDKEPEAEAEGQEPALQQRKLEQGDFLIQRTEPGISASLGVAFSY